MKYDIGFLGGGQLARMSILAASSLGLRCVSLDPLATSPAAQVAAHMQGELNDPASIARIASQCEVLTLENEFVPVEAIRKGFARAGFGQERLFPTTRTLEIIQDKYRQKSTLVRAGISCPRVWLFSEDSKPEFPVVAKSRFGGYDGRGTIVAHSEAELDPIRGDLESENWMLEEYVPFTRELATMVILRGSEAMAYPTVESVQVDQVCDHVKPCEADASNAAIVAARAISAFGLFGVEMFETAAGDIMVNEIAPRPHNSGHYTMDTGALSQFEAVARLAMNWPIELGQGREVVMVNLFGQGHDADFRKAIAAALAPDLSIHWYGKAKAKMGRKMGHINCWGTDALRRGLEARERFYSTWLSA